MFRLFYSIGASAIQSVPDGESGDFSLDSQSSKFVGSPDPTPDSQRKYENQFLFLS